MPEARRKRGIEATRLKERDLEDDKGKSLSGLACISCTASKQVEEIASAGLCGGTAGGKSSTEGTTGEVDSVDSVILSAAHPSASEHPKDVKC